MIKIIWKKIQSLWEYLWPTDIPTYGLNQVLLAKQEIGIDGEEAILKLHEIMDSVIESPEEYGNPKEVLAIVESLEYSMQAMWKFRRDRTYHTHVWRLEDCTCAKMDNRERMGSPLKSITSTCPYHGTQPED